MWLERTLRIPVRMARPAGRLFTEQSGPVIGFENTPNVVRMLLVYKCKLPPDSRFCKFPIGRRIPTHEHHQPNGAAAECCKIDSERRHQVGAGRRRPITRTHSHALEQAFYRVTVKPISGRYSLLGHSSAAADVAAADGPATAQDPYTSCVLDLPYARGRSRTLPVAPCAFCAVNCCRSTCTARNRTVACAVGLRESE